MTPSNLRSIFPGCARVRQRTRWPLPALGARPFVIDRRPLHPIPHATHLFFPATILCSPLRSPSVAQGPGPMANAPGREFAPFAHVVADRDLLFVPPLACGACSASPGPRVDSPARFPTANTSSRYATHHKMLSPHQASRVRRPPTPVGQLAAIPLCAAWTNTARPLSQPSRARSSHHRCSSCT